MDIQNGLKNPPIAIAKDILDRMYLPHVCEMNGAFQWLMVRKVLTTGKHVDDLTLREIRELIESARDEFERGYKHA